MPYTGVAAFTMGAIGQTAQVVVQNELGPIGYAYDYTATSSVLGMVGGDGLYGVTTGSNGLPSYPVASGLSYYLANSGTWVDFATKQYAATPWDSGVSTPSM